MALKQILLRKKLEDRKAALQQLRNKELEFPAKEAELEEAIGEAKTPEEQAAVEGEIEEIGRAHV